MTGYEQKNSLPIGVQDEGNVPHRALRGLLLELNTKFLEAFAGFLDVVDGDGDMAKSFAWFGVSACVAFEVGVGFGAVVMGKLKDTCVSQLIRESIKGQNFASRTLTREATLLFLFSRQLLA